MSIFPRYLPLPAALRPPFLEILRIACRARFHLLHYVRTFQFNRAPDVNITDQDKVILFWTPFFGTLEFNIGYGRDPFKHCPVSKRHCSYLNGWGSLKYSTAHVPILFIF